MNRAVLLLLPAVALGAAVRLTSAEKSEIVAEHNKARATVTPSAADMLQMEWDDKLGEDAYNYIKSCPTKTNSKGQKMLAHAPGPGTISSLAMYKKSQGENIYGSTAKSSVSDAVRKWDSERSGYTFIENNAGTCSIKACGHYTQVVFSKSDRVGCARSDCPNHDFRYGILCRYQLNRMIAPKYASYGYPGNLYTKGAPCSKCPSGTQCVGGKLCGKGGSGSVSTGGNPAPAPAPKPAPAPAPAAKCTYTKTDGQECSTYNLLGRMTLKACQDKCTSMGTKCGAIDVPVACGETDTCNCYYGSSCGPKSSTTWLGYTKSKSCNSVTAAGSTHILARLFKAMADFLA